MAAKKNNGRGKPLQKAARRARRVMSNVASSASLFLDAHARAAANMLLDPCNATISPGCYRGDQGYKTRVVSTVTALNTASTTCAAVYYIPSSNQLFTFDVTGSFTSGTWVIRPAPGSTYLATNANAQRSLGACVSVTPNTANLSTSGQVYTGLVTASSVNTGATITPDALITLCNKYGKISIDAPMETKFIPSSADENYSAPGVLADASDNIAILMVFIGLPAASGLTLRVTNIVEWKPATNLGIASESFLGNPSRNTIEHVKQEIRTKKPDFWTNVGKTAFSVVRGYATGGVMGAMGAAARGVSAFV